MSNVAIHSHRPGFQETQPTSQNIKALQGPRPKALGADPSLATWYQQAYAYYQSVQSGREPFPDNAAWDDFLNQMNWAYEQLHGPSWAGEEWGDIEPWDPAADGYGSPQGSQAYDPYGGIQGPGGNWIHNSRGADITFMGGAIRDIWSNDVKIRVPSLSATVHVVAITDQSVQPPEQIYKIVVTDQATGQEDIYHVHDIEDADIEILTYTEGQLQDETGEMKWSELKDGVGDDFAEVVNYPVEDLADGTHLVEAPMGQLIDFTPLWDSEDTNPETWEFWGDFNLNLRPSDRVQVLEGAPNDPEGFTIKITQRNGKVITIHTHEGFKGNLNANPENITWGGPQMNGNLNAGDNLVTEATPVTDTVVTDVSPVNPGSEAEDFNGVPPEFAEDFTLNGQTYAEEDADVEVEGDRPTDTENGDRVWDGKDFDIYTRSDGKENHIYARGDVTFHASSNQEYWLVAFEEGRYVIKVFDNADYSEEGLLETFTVDNMVDHLTFDVDPTHIRFEDPVGDEMDSSQIDTGTPQGAKVSLAGEEGATAGESPRVLQDLVWLTGKGEEEILAEIKRTYPEFNRYDENRDGKISADELEAAKSDGVFPPAVPDAKFWNLLYNLDADLASALSEFKETRNNNWYDDTQSKHYQAVRDRLVELLSVLYPEAGVSFKSGRGDQDDNIIFNGVEYDVIDQDAFDDASNRPPWEYLRFEEQNT